MLNYEISEINFFESNDKLKIRYGCFGKKDHEKILLLFPGRAECFEKYHDIIDYFIEKKYMVLSMDWRGQGGSQRELDDHDKGFVRSFSDYQKDLNKFLNDIVHSYSNEKEVYGIAHSMGGHNLMRYTIENKDSIIKKLVLVAPMLGIYTDPIPGFITKLVAEAGVKLGFGSNYLPGKGPYKRIEFEGNVLTSNFEKFSENLNFLDGNRELALGGPTYSWLYQAFLSMDFIKKNIFHAGKGNTNMKIIYGSEDKVILNNEIKNAGNYLSHGAMEIKGAKHEIMVETKDKKDKFLNACCDFFE